MATYGMGEIFTNNKSDETLIPIYIYKELISLIAKIQITQVKYGQRTEIDVFLKKIHVWSTGT